MHDVIQSPDHYTKGGIETIDIIKAKLPREGYIGYLEGNIIKYITRHRDKNGVQCLKKADWYLKRLIAEMEEQK